MKDDKKIAVYVRNKDITPSSYYRIVQYAKHFDGNVYIRDIAPKKIYRSYLNLNKRKDLKWLLNSIIYYIVMLIRVIFFLTIDYFKVPRYLIVSKSFCPSFTPFFLRSLLKKVMKKTTIYWDFDDDIVESGEISKAQADLLEKYSKRIIVTSEFLKSKIKKEYQQKVILLPTTDGDMQDYNEDKLLELRMSTFRREVRLVWVATSGNIPNLIKIIPTLDVAAKATKDVLKKRLKLIVVCNSPLKFNVKNLELININWTREIAIEEIFNAHIGIMPLIYNEYALGKGGFKLVQYISTGLPVIASNVGFNKEVVKNNSGIVVDDIKQNDGWIKAIIKIASSEQEWTKYSKNAKGQWANNFSYKQNLHVWKGLVGMK